MIYLCYLWMRYFVFLLNFKRWCQTGSALLCLASERNAGCNALIACSALKRQYRQILLHGAQALAAASSSSSSWSSRQDQSATSYTSSDVFFLFLHGDYDLIRRRMESRTGHFMKADLLRSQFDTLQPPLVGEENVLPLNIRWTLSDMAMEVEEHIASVKS